MIYYLIAISVVAVFMFMRDKNLAVRQQRRIPENTLHLFELAGGVFAIVFAMHLIGHKNKKQSYYLKTYSIAIIWVIILYWIQ